MAKLTWLGEDIPDPQGGEGEAGPSFTTIWGIRFDKDKAVDVDDETIIAKARGNRFFKVDDNETQARRPGRPPKVKDDDEQDQA